MYKYIWQYTHATLWSSGTNTDHYATFLIKFIPSQKWENIPYIGRFYAAVTALNRDKFW